MPSSFTISIIEDNPSFRKVLSLALSALSDYTIISEHSTAEVAIREWATAKNIPDLLLLDLSLPGISGVEAIPHIKKLLPKVKIIILSQSNSEEDVLRTITQGASGYLLKTSSIEDICHDIRVIAKGDKIIDASVAKYLFNRIEKNVASGDGVLPLSGRELSILELLGEGLLKKEISEKLSISYSTVDTHVSKIYDKLNVHNAPGAVGVAHRLGLLK